MNEKIKILADIVEANPGSQFKIEGEGWFIVDKDGETLADSYEYDWETEWYSSSSWYGAGLAEVLIELLKRRGLSITASAV